MEDKLTIHELACYLPYGLKMIFESVGGRVITLTGATIQPKNLVTITNGHGAMWLHQSGFKPLLRPLSQLTQTITHNGKEIVPIVELAKIAEKDHFTENNLKLKSLEFTHGVAWQNDGTTFGFVYSMEHNGFYIKSIPYIELVISNQPLLFQKLYEWKFDLHNLLSRNLALPIEN